MRALYRENTGTTLSNVTAPRVTNDQDVIIRVVAAGICRTDVYAAMGKIDTYGSRILGHEFSGIVTAIGAGVSHVQTGDRVAVMPIIGCGTCSACKENNPLSCSEPKMLGIHQDGCFAEEIRVSANMIYALPEGVSFKQGAYAEPLAASLSVLKAGIHADQTGVIIGENRFGKLIERILNVHGFNNVQIASLAHARDLETGAYDYAIETGAEDAVISEAARLLRPRGTLVIKSRNHSPVGVVLNSIVQKELMLRGVNYAPFDQTLALLARPDFQVDDLFGTTHDLSAFETMLKTGRFDEGVKTFLSAIPDVAENDNVRRT